MQGAGPYNPEGAFPYPMNNISTASRIKVHHHNQQPYQRQSHHTHSYDDHPIRYPPPSMVYTSRIMEHHPQHQQEMNAYYPQAQMYPASLPLPTVPTTQASGWVKPFNETEAQVEGILPYSYGMPRYGPVSGFFSSSNHGDWRRSPSANHRLLTEQLKLQVSSLSGADPTYLPL